MNVKIESSWQEALQDDFNSASFAHLRTFLKEEKKHYTVYPPGDKIFEAFRLTPLDKVKVVILGQDPYHGPGQSHGLCFSVSKGIKQPPSLKNIIKELHNDLGISIPVDGDLSSWARQGVLLLNATLTVRAHQAGSHQKQGWEKLTDSVIAKVSENCSHCVFILWGNYAQKKIPLINSDKHLILTSVHPSPLSAHRGFFGSKPFSKTNHWLQEKGLAPIDWNI